MYTTPIWRSRKICLCSSTRRRNFHPIKNRRTHVDSREENYLNRKTQQCVFNDYTITACNGPFLRVELGCHLVAIYHTTRNIDTLCVLRPSSHLYWIQATIGFGVGKRGWIPSETLVFKQLFRFRLDTFLARHRFGPNGRFNMESTVMQYREVINYLSVLRNRCFLDV